MYISVVDEFIDANGDVDNISSINGSSSNIEEFVDASMGIR